MNCPRCGRKLIKVTTLTKEEIDDYTYASNKLASANSALENANDICSDLTPEQTYSFFKAVFDELAEGKFLQFTFEKELVNKYKGLDNGYEIISDTVYIHSAEE